MKEVKQITVSTVKEDVENGIGLREMAKKYETTVKEIKDVVTKTKEYYHSKGVTIKVKGSPTIRLVGEDGTTVLYGTNMTSRTV